MIEAYESSAVRAAEEPLLAAGVPLMDRAAFALAAAAVRELRARTGRPGLNRNRAVLLVGPGNNGGDTLYAGARVAARGVHVVAVLVGDRVHDAALAALRAAGGTVVACTGEDTTTGALAGDIVTVAEAADLMASADIVLDGLLGIGGRGGLRGSARDLVAATVAVLGTRPLRSRPVVVAVDVPSGIGVDDGAIYGAADGPVLTADLTVTFGAVKSGLLLPPASAHVGRIEVVDIGLGLPGQAGPATTSAAAVRRLTAADLVSRGVLAVPAADAHKYTRGVLGVVAGTQQFPGAAVLTVSGAIRAGVGMVRYLGAREVTAAVLAARPEAVPAGGRVQAWALGPGISPAPPATDEAARAQQGRIRHALAQVTGLLGSDVVGDVVPAAVDAGAIALLPRDCPPWLVITPHAGELAELLRSRGESVERSDVEAHPLAWARRARDLTGATVLLKGATTVVVGPGVTYTQADGPSWLATAGAGDVLTGLLGSLLAAHSVAAVKDPALPALLAASASLLHGLAAHRANPGGPVAALDVARALPATIADVLAGRDPLA
ncbi:yjeF N-terminal region [Sanguibacter gelidistatuariae]|uniref:Bifunctional NAD(P)H-hydrate repair enzyme n=1 Tax=Sanguibacter gelidistatuariae TaxID=1814289 RepID=A0A1G6KH78_9MICO|nr:bifunctional ADP-dependent NAD(P)H-hydrate dehydratase/NAD(P)H-hydrate epimerase [Sanguibacter gelidistatuariae]SDC30324.1 yjeF N-terminal region [Sanguibacter gelidistatuariae]